MAMHNKLVEIPLRGIIHYLIKRTQLRFMNKLSVGPSEKKITIFGQVAVLDLNDLEQKYLAVDCVREPENLIIYRAIAAYGLVNTFIDIGANCGHVAASIVHNYSQVVLIEPNPKLASILRDIFRTKSNVTIRECAIVDKVSVGQLVLSVPAGSSGLATLGKTAFSEQHEDMHRYVVKASYLGDEVKESDLQKAYIKIDVEGFEANIIQSATYLINNYRPIVGFEALSISAALDCARKFDGYAFYCARFDFLNSSGALSKSIGGILRATLLGAAIEVLRLSDLENIKLENFSQIYAVPSEKTSEFEDVVLQYTKQNPVFDLRQLKTWS